MASHIRSVAQKCASAAMRSSLRSRCALTYAMQTATAIKLPQSQSRQLQSSAPRKATITYSPPCVKINHPAPAFDAPAVVDGEIKNVSLESYKGKWVVLLFYPKDFTFVCPTEIIAFSDRAKEFEAIGANVIAISTDTEESHLAWIRTPRKKGGLGYMQIPIVADTLKSISADYGVLIEDLGIALRGLFIINPQGVLEQITVNNLPVGRNVDEALRIIQAHQFVEQHGEVCPANWKPGDKTMIADADGSMAYFESTATDEPDLVDVGPDIVVPKTAAEFHSIVGAAQSRVVVDYMAPWCGKCKQIMPAVNALAEEYRGKVTVVKVDTTEEALGEVGQGVTNLPTFQFYKDGVPAEGLGPVVGYKKRPLQEAVKALSEL